VPQGVRAINVVGESRGLFATYLLVDDITDNAGKNPYRAAKILNGTRRPQASAPRGQPLRVDTEAA